VVEPAPRDPHDAPSRCDERPGRGPVLLEGTRPRGRSGSPCGRGRRPEGSSGGWRPPLRPGYRARRLISASVIARFELLRGQRAGEVEERAGPRGHRDPAPHGVDAGVERIQPPVGDAVVDRAIPRPAARADCGHDAMLARCETRDLTLGGSRRGFPPYSGADPPLDRHPRSSPAPRHSAPSVCEGTPRTSRQPPLYRAVRETPAPKRGNARDAPKRSRATPSAPPSAARGRRWRATARSRSRAPRGGRARCRTPSSPRPTRTARRR